MSLNKTTNRGFSSPVPGTAKSSNTCTPSRLLNGTNSATTPLAARSNPNPRATLSEILEGQTQLREANERIERVLNELRTETTSVSTTKSKQRIPKELSVSV